MFEKVPKFGQPFRATKMVIKNIGAKVRDLNQVRGVGFGKKRAFHYILKAGFL